MKKSINMYYFPSNIFWQNDETTNKLSTVRKNFVNKCKNII